MWLRSHLLKARPLAATAIGYYVSRDNMETSVFCQADVFTRNSKEHLLTRVSKPLSRNFIADAADVASPAVVNIGYIYSCLFLRDS